MEKRNMNMVLTKISEECGEVTQMCSKVIFYGIGNTSPKPLGNRRTNREKLIEEMGDVLANFKVLIEDTGALITWEEVWARADEKYKKLEFIIPKA